MTSGQATRTAPKSSTARPSPRGLSRSRKWRTAGLLLAVAALALAAAGSLLYGSRQLPAGEVVAAVFSSDRSTNAALIVSELRVPRTLIGIAVGVALGLSGALMQGVTRNPLADPGILGVNAGASLAVVVAIYVFGVSSLSVYVWFALVGAAVASVVVYGLGSIGRDGASPVKLALAGAAVSALLIGFTSAILLLDLTTLDRYRFWVVGSLAGRDITILTQVTPFLLAGAVLAFGSARSLNVLAMGDDVARSLGARVGLARGVSALGVILLTGAAVSAAGPIGFVGLVIAHIARSIVGADYRWIMAYSAVLAPILLLVADTVGRVIFRPGEVQVGVVTAVVGAPFFIVLIRRSRLTQL